jgi:cytochrome c oxidase cbb3-type subunit 2
MSRSSTIFAGLLGSFAVSIYVMVLIPQTQLGGLQPSFTEEEGKYTEIYPVQNGAADQGRAIYIREGCFTCHSQQVRDPQSGTDVERGWGPRRTVARDYLFDRPVVLGHSRLGPDLANAGWAEWRNEPADDTRKPRKRDAAWHYLHLYSPRQIVTESNHPPYRYLFEERPISGQRLEQALNLTGKNAPPPGKQIVASNEAKSLVAYLLTLDRSHPLKEVTAGSPEPSGVPAAAAGAAPPAGAPAPAAAAAPAAK